MRTIINQKYRQASLNENDSQYQLIVFDLAELWKTQNSMWKTLWINYN